MPRLTVLAAAIAALLLAGCSGGIRSSDDPAIPFPDGPVDIEGVVQHLLEAPDLPGGLGAVEPELAELRAPEMRDRHHVFLVVVAAGARLDADLDNGAVVRVPEGVTLVAEVPVSSAPLDGERVAAPSVETCEAPCEVVGPALVAREGFLTGIGVRSGWELLVPAPTE